MRSKRTFPFLPLLLLSCLSMFALPVPDAASAALTPSMGWNSWNHFGHRVTNQTTRDIGLGFRGASVGLHDVREQQDHPGARGTYHAEVPQRGVVMLHATQR